MGKTICIQIDNNSLPEGCGEDVEVLDCCCINDFCSLVGDALVGDLKDENGKSFYRLINPVGKLLMDFKDVDEKAFNSIIEDWFDILGNLLHKGMQGDDIVIHFPQQYVDWLLHSDNPYHEQVGKELQRQNGKITLSSEAIDDDVIASINYKVSHKLQEKKEDYSFVVFSNPIIRNSSFVVKRVRLDGIEFMRYDSWIENQKIQINSNQCSIVEDNSSRKSIVIQTDLRVNKVDLSFYDWHFSRDGYFFKHAFGAWYGETYATSGSFIFHCKKILWLIGIQDETIIDDSIYKKPISFFRKILFPVGFKSHTFDDDQFAFKESIEFTNDDYLIIFGFSADKKNVINFDSHPMSLEFIALYKDRKNFYKAYEPNTSLLHFYDKNGEKAFYTMFDSKERIDKIQGNISFYG